MKKTKSQIEVAGKNPQDVMNTMTPTFRDDILKVSYGFHREGVHPQHLVEESKYAVLGIKGNLNKRAYKLDLVCENQNYGFVDIPIKKITASGLEFQNGSSYFGLISNPKEPKDYLGLTKEVVLFDESARSTITGVIREIGRTKLIPLMYRIESDIGPIFLEKFDSSKSVWGGYSPLEISPITMIKVRDGFENNIKALEKKIGRLYYNNIREMQDSRILNLDV
jgi:hypothetical protein